MITRSTRRGVSFDHIVGALLEKPRHVETERLGGLAIDDEIEFSRFLRKPNLTVAAGGRQT
jgi:hypothetical protein